MSSGRKRVAWVEGQRERKGSKTTPQVVGASSEGWRTGGAWLASWHFLELCLPPCSPHPAAAHTSP